LNPQKNFSLFLDIAAAVATEIPEARFLLAGEGPEDQLLRDHAARLGITDRVVFAGYIPDTRMVYAAADILVMPSRFEGLPMTLLEAMAMRLPIVASRLDGLAEILDSGKDALLVEPGNREGFVRALDQLWREPAFGEALAGAAYQKVQTEYSARVMAARVESVYAACIQEARA
jgi:glycosyltransferase involved in cell wall biosynthesis